MQVWQADFYRRPLVDEQDLPLWELLICDPAQTFTFAAFCPQPQANSQWLVNQIRTAAQRHERLPDEIHLFRPQTLQLFQPVGQDLGIEVRPTRRTSAIKHWLRQRAQWYPQLENYSGQPYEPVKIEQPPPQPLPETLLGERWQFTAISAADLQTYFSDQPIPCLELPTDLLPVNLGLPSTAKIPGVRIEGGRAAMNFARWIQERQPANLKAVLGEANGLVLEAGLAERWILFTYSDEDVSSSAHMYEQRKVENKGLHFLLVQPDNSGMTSTGLWLLQEE